MFFVGVISTLVPYLITMGMILATLYQVNTEVGVARDTLLVPITEQMICIDKQDVLTCNYTFYNSINQESESVVEDEEVIRIEKRDIKNLFSANLYQSITIIHNSGLSPPLVI